MSMIFEFTEMKQAEAFVRTVKERFALDGQVFDDGDEANEAALFPWVLDPPVALIDRWHGYPMSDDCFEGERKVEALANEFGGEFVGT